MPAAYVIFPTVKLKYVTVTGATHLEELRSLATQYRDDPQYSPELRQLVDLSGLTAARSKFIDVLTLRNFYIRNFGPLESPIPVAIFAPTDMGYGIAMMFSSLMVGQSVMKVRVFDRREAALEWLGVSEDVLFPEDVFATMRSPAP